MDVCGYGESVKLYEFFDYGVEKMYGDIVNLMDYLGFESVELIGFLMGGMMILNFVYCYLDCVC